LLRYIPREPEQLSFLILYGIYGVGLSIDKGYPGNLEQAFRHIKFFGLAQVVVLVNNFLLLRGITTIERNAQREQECE
jgi:hypothetical protein